MHTKLHTPMSRRLLVTAMAGILVLPLGSGYAATHTSEQTAKSAAEAKMAAEQRPALSEVDSIGHYSGWNDPDMTRIAIHSGRVLLRHLEAAHAALENHKTGEARSALSAAEGFAEGLQLMAPYTVVVDKLRNAKEELLSSSTSIIFDDLLPIYTSLDEMADYAPELANQARMKVDQAAQHAKQGENQQAAKKLEEVAADISSTSIFLPVNYVEQQVEAARISLDRDPADTKTANAAIDNALSSLVHANVNLHLFPNEQATPANSSAQSG